MRRVAILLLAFLAVTVVGCGGGSDSSVSGNAGEHLAANIEDHRRQAGARLIHQLWGRLNEGTDLWRAVDLCYYRSSCINVQGDAVIALCDGVLPGATDDEIRAATQTVISEHFEVLDRSDRSDISEALRDIASDISDGDVPWCD